MDFWAGLEHRIYYKYDRDVPQALLEDLREAAGAANRLDREMEQIHDEVARLHPTHEASTTEDAVTAPCAGTGCDEGRDRDDGPDAPSVPPGWTGDPGPSVRRFNV